MQANIDDKIYQGTIKHTAHKKRLVKKKKKKSIQEVNDFVSATSSLSSLESTLSFCSVTSVNDSDLSDTEDPDELIDMINLHSHMNLPIIESPLLLSCYSQHLSHYYCQVSPSSECTGLSMLELPSSTTQSVYSVQ